MLQYKIDVLQELKEAGYNTNRLAKENIISPSSIQKIREGTVVGNIILDKLCELLDMQPGNIIRYVPDEKEKSEKELSGSKSSQKRRTKKNERD